MGTSLQTRLKPLGLFELDAAGTVLYARIERDGNSGLDLTGLNFYDGMFDEIEPFENVEEFRQMVYQFTRGFSPADNFTFTCQFSDGPLTVKVLMARIRERESSNRTKSVLVHIRKVE